MSNHWIVVCEIEIASVNSASAGTFYVFTPLSQTLAWRRSPFSPWSSLFPHPHGSTVSSSPPLVFLCSSVFLGEDLGRLCNRSDAVLKSSI